MDRDAHAGPRRAARMRDRVVAVIFVAALALPGLALILGMRPVDIENRRPADLPPFELMAMADPAFYARVDRFLSDSLPVRAEAVMLRARIVYQLLGASPTPLVVLGSGDWLFPRLELEPSCTTPPEDVEAQADRLARALAAQGVSFRLAIVPDKGSIHPEGLPASDIDARCTGALRAAMRQRVTARPDLMTELWSPLEAERANGSGPLYWRGDSHWTLEGALAGVRELVTSVQPGVWGEDEVLRVGDLEHVTDLSRMIGLPAVESAPNVTLRRIDDLHVTEIPTGSPRTTLWFVSDATPVIPGTTLFVVDSTFGPMFQPLLAPWFESSVFVATADLVERQPGVVEALPPFDRVVVATVERDAYHREYETMLVPIVELAIARAEESA